jgi:LPS sulfotransferase NodH
MPDRNVLILSEPRSGSHWFQSCLPGHYSLGEFFNVRNIEKFDFKENHAEPGRYLERDLSTEREAELLTERFAVCREFPRPYSVKVHKHQLNDAIVAWINGGDARLVLLERRDKVRALNSLLIANHLKKFMGTLTPSTIRVTRKNFDESITALWGHEAKLRKISRPWNAIFYEDMLVREKSVDFDPGRSWVVNQFSRHQVQIENWLEVMDWLAAENLPRNPRSMSPGA